MYLYKGSGDPIIASVWVLPIENVVMAPDAAVAAVVIANVTAARCKRVDNILLGRVLGAGAFGQVHIGAQPAEFSLFVVWWFVAVSRPCHAHVMHARR